VARAIWTASPAKQRPSMSAVPLDVLEGMTLVNREV
jgi:hypothetical protein